MNAEFVSTH